MYYLYEFTKLTLETQSSKFNHCIGGNEDNKMSLDLFNRELFLKVI